MGVGKKSYCSYRFFMSSTIPEIHSLLFFTATLTLDPFVLDESFGFQSQKDFEPSRMALLLIISFSKTFCELLVEPAPTVIAITFLCAIGIRSIARHMAHSGSQL